LRILSAYTHNATTPGGGWLAEYEFTKLEAMHRTASQHDWVIRPNEKKVKGKNYTLRMAQHDFKAAK